MISASTEYVQISSVGHTSAQFWRSLPGETCQSFFFVEILITVTEKWHSLKSVPKTELTRKPTKSAAWLTCALWNVKTSDQNCINWRWSAKMKFHPFAESSPARSEHYSIVMHSAVIAHLTASSEINITVLEPWTTYARPLRVVSSHLGMSRQCAECY